MCDFAASGTFPDQNHHQSKRMIRLLVSNGFNEVSQDTPEKEQTFSEQ